MHFRFYIVMIFAVCLPLFLPGCIRRTVPPPAALAEDFSCIMDIRCKGAEIRAKLTRPVMASYQFEIEAPSVLSGFKLLFDGDNFTISYLGLTCDIASAKVPAVSFAAGIKNALEAVSLRTTEYTSKNGIDTYSGQCGSGKFTVGVSADGLLKHISLPALELEAEISDFTKSPNGSSAILPAPPAPNVSVFCINVPSKNSFCHEHMITQEGVLVFGTPSCVAQSRLSAFFFKDCS